MTKIRSTDDSRIQDRRGQGGGGGFSFPGLGRSGGSLPIPGGKAGGGGLIGLLVIAAIIFLPRLLGGGGGTNLLAPEADQQVAEGGGDGEACQTEAEQIVCGANNDVQDYWERAYPQAFGQPYTDTELVFFSGGTNTGCGPASSQTGPFYCPADALVYIDLDFLDQLQSDFGAPGDLATAVHRRPRVRPPRAEPHRAERRRPAGERRDAAADGRRPRVAGRLLRRGLGPRRRPAPRCRTVRSSSSHEEISEALEAAAAVGDDRIQMQTQGRVDPESFTHGTSDRARELVPPRLQHRRPHPVQHVRRDLPLESAAAVVTVTVQGDVRRRACGTATRLGRCRTGGARASRR